MTMTWTLSQVNAYNFGVGGPGEGRHLGILFQGKKGTLLSNYDLCQAVTDEGKAIEGPFPQTTEPSPGHWRTSPEEARSWCCSASWSGA